MVAVGILAFPSLLFFIMEVSVPSTHLIQKDTLPYLGLETKVLNKWIISNLLMESWDQAL